MKNNKKMTTTFRNIVRIQQREAIGTDEGLLAEIQFVQNTERNEITVTVIASNGVMYSNVFIRNTRTPAFDELQQYLPDLEGLTVVQLSDWEVCIFRNRHSIFKLVRATIISRQLWAHLNQMLPEYFENKLLHTNVFK